ncbi:MAG TPA: zinc-dependent metalloprotease family protein [Mycobacteriales bacterium]|nr:zinc-dependent metalloprotease family protein [Mycobacteriales bacterium]
MTRRFLAPGCALALAGLLTTGAAAATPTRPAIELNADGPRPGVHGIIDVEHLMEDVDCETSQLAGPAATSTAHLTGAKAISLDVLVLVDVARGAEIAATRDRKAREAAERKLYASVRKSLIVGTTSYDPLDITLKYDDFALLQPLVKGKPRVRTDDPEKIIALAKTQLGGKRRGDVDVVYVVTDRDLRVAGFGNAVAGLADCIGGVALPDRAFAVGETGVLTDDGGRGIGPVTFYKDLTAKIAAHEIGHLFGGHHHYQECGTAAPTAVGRGELGPCTLMTNAADFQTFPFSTLNSIVVRGHAEKWAVATDK